MVHSDATLGKQHFLQELPPSGPVDSICHLNLSPSVRTLSGSNPRLNTLFIIHLVESFSNMRIQGRKKEESSTGLPYSRHFHWNPTSPLFRRLRQKSSSTFFENWVLFQVFAHGSHSFGSTGGNKQGFLCILGSRSLG